MAGEVVGFDETPNLGADDVPALLAALLSSGGRVQPVALSSGTVWIKRHIGKDRRAIHAAQRITAALLRMPFLRPSPFVRSQGLVARDIRRMGKFADKGVPIAEILYASGSAIVFSDVGQTVEKQLSALKKSDARAHDDLLVFCCAELGRLHAQGLCHGRPFPRDLFIRQDRLGYIDFEEEPEAVMPLETAQARDIWLLFLQLSKRAVLGKETQDRAYRAWSEAAPEAAIAQLRKLTGILGGFLWLARLIGRIHMGTDLRQFIMATSYMITMFNG